MWQKCLNSNDWTFDTNSARQPYRRMVISAESTTRMWWNVERERHSKIGLLIVDTSCGSAEGSLATKGELDLRAESVESERFLNPALKVPVGYVPPGRVL